MTRAVACLVGIVTIICLAGCDDDDGTTMEPESPQCEFSEITSRNRQGELTGAEDPDDWCEQVVAAPNPAEGGTTIAVNLSSAQHVRIGVSDATAGEISVLVAQDLSAGPHTIHWDLTAPPGIPIAAGIYCITVEAEDFSCSGDVLVQ